MNHSGNITTTEVWALADSPHILTDNTYIRDGGVVTIEAGCTLQINDAKSLYVGNVGTGKIVMNGTNSNHISVIKQSATGWQYFYIYSQAKSGECSFKYVDFSGGRHVNGGNRVEFAGGNPPANFEHITFSDMTSTVLKITGWNLDFTTQNITYDNTCGEILLNMVSCTGVMTLQDFKIDGKLYSQYAIQIASNTQKTTLKRWTVKNCSKTSDYATFAFITSCEVDVVNSLLYDDLFAKGLFYYSGNSSGLIRNCTFNGVKGIATCASSGILRVKNCLITNGVSGAYGSLYRIQGSFYSNYNYFYNNVSPNYTGTILEKTGDQIALGDPLYYLLAGKDFHLKSKGGNYTNAGSWVTSTVTSPAIDLGDPTDDYSLEPYYNGDRINIGSEGGTEFASKTLVTQWNVYLFDTITLTETPFVNVSLETKRQSESTTISDAIILNVSREKELLFDSLSLSDSVYLWNDGKWLGLNDSIILADELNQNLTREKEQYVEGSMTVSDILSMTAYKLIDLGNDFRSAKQEEININNKFSLCKQVLNNINNIVLTVKGSLIDFVNKINTKRQEFYNIKNDVRILFSWQIPGDTGVQSLGKEYIKVYINTIEQTDIDIDSISITKGLNNAHTANFVLGRAFDAVSPVIESIIEIKYHIWTLFKGYITQITPTNNPENIQLYCEDEMWKQNKTRVYFQVGHLPFGASPEQYYYKYISTALSTLGINGGFGGIVPQTINCWGKAKSETITDLITQSGNFAWFYNVDGTPNYWRAGEGSIINLEAQEIGKNLGLYQVLSHSFKSDTTNIINRYRVQMGTFVNQIGNRNYQSYDYEYFAYQPTPMWDEDLEVIATKENKLGYGFNYRTSANEYLYNDVFKKYKLSNESDLELALSKWTDRYTPRVEIGGGGFGWICSRKEGLQTDGFSIDYKKNGSITFNEPVYYKHLNDYGEPDAVKRAQVYVCLYKKKLHTTDNNPLYPMYFYIGSGSNTGDLSLSGLSIQSGGSYTDENGDRKYIPSWNDTAFAIDIANWELSKTSYEKISGNINLTLDAVCFYNIDLSKRVRIPGIMNNHLNIISMTYNLSDFQVSIQLESNHSYYRTTSIQSRGEDYF